jgi:hypothetical protein
MQFGEDRPRSCEGWGGGACSDRCCSKWRVVKILSRTVQKYSEIFVGAGPKICVTWECGI